MVSLGEGVFLMNDFWSNRTDTIVKWGILSTNKL